MTTSSGDIGDAFLTVADVAELLKLNQQTVRNWIDQGSLPALKVGRRVRIRRSDLERVLEQGYIEGSKAGGGREGVSAEAFWGGEPVGVAEPASGGGSEAPRSADLPPPAESTETSGVDGRGSADPPPIGH